MKALGADPSAEQLQRLMLLMDADRSGTIEWDEFLSVMSTWLKEDSSAIPGTSDVRADATMVRCCMFVHDQP
jgi:hypothetical protein